MNFVNQSFRLLHQGEGVTGLLKHIEFAGRTCYKSEDKITSESAKAFVEQLKVKHHLSVLEHGTVYLNIFPEEDDKGFIDLFINNKYTKYERIMNDSIGYAITTNFRVIIENGWEDALVYMCNPTWAHPKRVTVRFETCIHVYKDITRHRLASFSIESTRYCNYSKNKFGNKLNFVKAVPYENSSWINKLVYKTCLKVIEWSYKFLVKHGWKAESAAELLPQATKADVVMTAFVEDWYHIFDLRADSHAHPLVQELFKPLKEHFIRFSY